MKSFPHFLRYQFPALAWMTIIFIQSSISYLEVPDIGFSAQDKAIHIVVYAILGWLLIRALLFQSHEKIRKNAIWIALVIGCFYGMTDEIHQAFVPGRFADAGDLIADFLGVFSISGLYFYRKKTRQTIISK